MELTYKVRGADGKEYGPATQDQIAGWLREGRIGPQTEVTRSDIDYWSPAANFTELRGNTPPAAQPRPVSSAAATDAMPRSDAVTEAHMRSGAGWFYWIAALSLINSGVALSGSHWGFALGLGLTQFIDAFGQTVDGSKVIAVVLDLVVIGVFVLFGVFAGKGHTWAFVVGMVLYALDSLLALLGQNWLSLGFHGLALFFIFRGFQACRELKAS